MAAPTLDRPSSADPVEPTEPAPPPPQQPIRIAAVSSAGAWSVLGSAAGAIGLTWVVGQRLVPLTGALGFWLIAFVVFLGLYAAVCWAQFSARSVTDKLVSVFLTVVALLVLVIVLNQIIFTMFRGAKAISHGNFWTSTMATTGPLEPLTSGGMVHAMVGSLEQLGLATLFSVPLGILAALYLVEINDWLARPIRVIVEAMTALPEIIAGLFIYVFIILTLGVQQSGFAASLALTVMMIPIVTRTSEVVLRLVPGPLREASYALGSSQFRTVWNVVLPTARSGLTTAVILAMARAVGETSPVLLTSGFTKELNTNPFSGPQASLPLYIYNYVRYPQPNMVARAFGGALALMIMVLVLFVLARMIGGAAPGELSKRQRRRIARISSADPDELKRVDEPDPATIQVPTFIAPGFPDPPHPGGDR